MNLVKYFAATVIALSTMNCEAQKSEKDIVKTNVENMKNGMIQMVQLEEITRGTKKMVQKSAEETILSVNEKVSSTKNTDQNWKKLSAIISTLNLNKLNSYPSPTTDRYHDGALAATIKITDKNGTVYESQTFDSGKPPKELAALYTELASNFVWK